MFDKRIIRSLIGPKDQGPQAEGREATLHRRLNGRNRIGSLQSDESGTRLSLVNEQTQPSEDTTRGKGFNKKKAFLRLCALGTLSLVPLVAAENVWEGLQVQGLSRDNKESSEICRPRNIFFEQCDSEENTENFSEKEQDEQELVQIGGKIITYRDLVQQTLEEFDQRLEKKLDRFDQHREENVDKSIPVVMKELRKTQRELQATQQELRKTQRRLKNARGDLWSVQWVTLSTYVMWMITTVSLYYLSERLKDQSERFDIQRALPGIT